MVSLLLPPISRNCSHVLLGFDGAVRSGCGKTDAEDLAGLKTSSLTTPRELETIVERGVVRAWQEFRNGNHRAAERILGELPDSDVFTVPPARAKSTRWWRLLIGISVALMGAGILIQCLPSAWMGGGEWIETCSHH
jgi:hypothetical protein